MKLIQGIKMKTWKLTLLSLLTLGLANCSTMKNTDSQRSLASTVAWNHCYDIDKNTVYFIPENQITTCSSKTFFRGPEGYEMTDSGITDDGFTTGKAGTPQQLIRRDRSRVFISSWNNLGSYNEILVIEPNTETNTAKLLCRLNNHSEVFQARQSKDSQTIQVLIREPKTNQAKDDENFVYRWKDCQ